MKTLQHALLARVKHTVGIDGKNTAMSMKTRIKSRMDELGKKVTYVAKTSGVTKSAVYQWLDGTTEPGIGALVKLAEALKTYEKWLVTGLGPKDRGAWVALEPEEAALLLAYKDLPPDVKTAIYGTTMQLAEQQKKKKGGKE